MWYFISQICLIIQKKRVKDRETDEERGIALQRKDRQSQSERREKEGEDREIREKQRGAPLLEVYEGGGGSRKKGGEGPMTRDQ